jgi:Holliday junction DNA helicase RuvA
MIAYVKGTLAEKSPSRAVVEACGIGYELVVPLSTYDRLPRTGEEVKLLAHHVVREDDEALFGFATEAEREMFAKLTGVSGVGPRTAVSILSGLTVGELSLAIASGDPKRIASVKGVGKKTAGKICIELKDKVDAIGALAATTARAGDRSPVLRDAVLALAALGFGEEAANKMVAAAVAEHPEVSDAQTLVRFSLAGK